MESFWARPQVELLNTRKWATTLELAAAMADYFDNFYNVERRHSYLGSISPTEYETLWSSMNRPGMSGDSDVPRVARSRFA
jgi:putative transposase